MRREPTTGATSLHIPIAFRSARAFTRSAPASGFRGCRTTKIRRRGNWGHATFTSLTTFLQSTVSSFQVIPTANELGWRSFFGAWYVQDAIRLRPQPDACSSELRHEFTNGWNEVSGRAANYLTDSNGLLITTPRVGKRRLHRQQRQEACSRRAWAWHGTRSATARLRFAQATACTTA